ncbi:hypothetical protein MASR1M60_03530 [Rhodocyclaceae bacterium]
MLIATIVESLALEGFASREANAAVGAGHHTFWIRRHLRLIGLPAHIALSVEPDGNNDQTNK